MVVLSPRFALLTCLCAALPLALPTPVEAARVYGLHAMEKRASSHSRNHSPSVPSTHGHDGKHHGHKTPHQRAPELPPLLRRHSIHEPMMAQGRHDRDSCDDARVKVPRSAFAHNRHHREHGPNRRSSVYVAGEHDDKYLVSWGDVRAGTDQQTSYTNGRRQLDESTLPLGRIDIMAAGPPGNNTQRLASLMIDTTPIDWRSGQSTAKAFQLNASTTNQTQFIMMPMDVRPNTAESFDKHVALATEVFDANSAEMVMFCATYDSDPSPGSMSTILMTPCSGQTQVAAPGNDATDPCVDDESPTLHQSQIFYYDPVSGKVQPISAATPQDDGNNHNGLAGCAGARVRRGTTNSTTSSSATRSSASQQARNVTLVYVAGALEVPVSSPNSTTHGSTSPSPSPSPGTGQPGQAAVMTTTITTTVVTTVTAPDSTPTPAQAAASVSVSASQTPTPTSPKTLSTRTAFTSSPSRSPPSSSPSSAPTRTTSRTPAVANESLAIEIVGVRVSDAGSSSSTSGATITTPATSSGSASSSRNAQAAASSVARPIAPRRRI